MAHWRPCVVISAVTWQRYCANKNGSEKPVSNCWRRVDLPGKVVHRASQGGWSKRLSLMHMGALPQRLHLLPEGGQEGGELGPDVVAVGDLREPERILGLLELP